MKYIHILFILIFSLSYQAAQASQASQAEEKCTSKVNELPKELQQLLNSPWKVKDPNMLAGPPNDRRGAEVNIEQIKSSSATASPTLKLKLSAIDYVPDLSVCNTKNPYTLIAHLPFWLDDIRLGMVLGDNGEIKLIDKTKEFFTNGTATYKIKAESDNIRWRTEKSNRTI